MLKLSCLPVWRNKKIDLIKMWFSSHVFIFNALKHHNWTNHMKLMNDWVEYNYRRRRLNVNNWCFREKWKIRMWKPDTSFGIVFGRLSGKYAIRVKLINGRKKKAKNNKHISLYCCQSILSKTCELIYSFVINILWTNKLVTRTCRRELIK